MIEPHPLPDGGAVRAVRLAAYGMRAVIVDRGAALADLRLDGWPHPLVLGFSDLRGYADNAMCLGAIVGRVAGRVGGARVDIDGRAYRLDANERGANTLHGGSGGSATRAWRIEAHGPDTATLADTLPDGHMGFPGRIDVRAVYTLRPRGLHLRIEAATDAATFCAFAPHPYFSLTGSGLDGHRLRVDADRYLPLRVDGLPGPPAPVAGTRFDLRAPAPVPDALDHNLCLSETPGPLRPVARLAVPGLAMDIATTEPGLQLFDAAGLSVAKGAGLDGLGYGPRAGLAMEPQRWPDAPNNAWRAQALLRPGETRVQETLLAFARG